MSRNKENKMTNDNLKTWPEKIWLTTGSGFPDTLHEAVVSSYKSAGSNEIKYIRADLAQPVAPVVPVIADKLLNNIVAVLLEAAEVLASNNWRGDLQECLKELANLANIQVAGKVNTVSPVVDERETFEMQNECLMLADTIRNLKHNPSDLPTALPTPDAAAIRDAALEESAQCCLALAADVEMRYNYDEWEVSKNSANAIRAMKSMPVEQDEEFSFSISHADYGTDFIKEANATENTPAMSQFASKADYDAAVVEQVPKSEFLKRLAGLQSEMIVCSTCGYKRCPHATNANHLCTNSNDVGQIGVEQAPKGE